MIEVVSGIATAVTDVLAGETVSQALAVVIPLTVATSVWLAGNRKTMSWPLGIAAHLVTGIYALVSEDWGWLLGPGLVAPVFVRNWVKWRREQQVPQPLVLRDLSEEEAAWVKERLREYLNDNRNQGVNDD